MQEVETVQIETDQYCKCQECGALFIPRTVTQRYCSLECGVRYRKTHTSSSRYPSITFTCACCGEKVVTAGGKDRRSRFCSEACEKRYWKHAERYKHRMPKTTGGRKKRVSSSEQSGVHVSEDVRSGSKRAETESMQS